MDWFRVGTRVLAIYGIGILFAAPAFAQDHLITINDTAPPNFSNDPALHDASYLNLSTLDPDKVNKIMGTPNGTKRSPTTKLLPGEFYTSLTFVNRMKDREILKHCGVNSGVNSRYVAVKLAAEFIGNAGSLPTGWFSEQVLFTFGDPNAKSPAPNCIFGSMGDRNGPYLLYTGLGDRQSEYNLHFVATSGSTSDPSVLQTIAKLALSIAPVIPGAPVIAAPVAALINTAAADFDKLVSVNTSVSYQYLAIIPELGKRETKTPYWNGAYISISPPSYLQDAKAPSDILIYQRRSASIVMESLRQHPELKADEILSLQSLGSPHRCIPTTGNCPKEDTFVKVLGATFDPFLDVAPAKPDVSKNKWISVFTTCDKIKSTAQALGLTPIDALLVRWAMLEKYRLIDAMSDPSRKETIEQAESVVSMQGVGRARDVCWNSNDSAAFDQIKSALR